MAFTEFYLTQGSAASDINGGGPNLGANDGPIYSTTDVDCEAGDPTFLVDQSGSDWSGVQVGDWLCYDTASAKEFRRVVDLFDIPNGIIQVHRACSTGTGRYVRVGGAFATFRGAIANVGQNVTADYWPSGIATPRLNVKYESGTAYAETVAVVTADFGTPTELLPFVIEGYETTAGDLDWVTTTTRTLIDWGTSGVTPFKFPLWATCVNVYLTQSLSSTSNLVDASEGTFVNCHLSRQGIGRVLYNFSGVARRCLLSNTTSANYELVSMASKGIIDSCVLIGEGSGTAAAIKISNANCLVANSIIMLAGNGISLSAGSTGYNASIKGNIIVGMANHGLQVLSNGLAARFDITDNIVANNGGWGIDNGVSGTPTMYMQNCRGNFFYANTSGNYPATIIPLWSNTDLGANDPFENYAADPKDLRIKTTSAAYRVRHDLPSGLDADASFLDAGAIQRANPAGGGSGVDLPDMMTIGA